MTIIKPSKKRKKELYPLRRFSRFKRKMIEFNKKVNGLQKLLNPAKRTQRR